MEMELQLKMNPRLYIRDPESSELGRAIIRHGIKLIHEIGFEEFTFKKLAAEAGISEPSIYRYFENKHRLLTYIISWFWTWLEYQLQYHINNVPRAEDKIRILIDLLTFRVSDRYNNEYINKDILAQIVISEANKSYLTKNVSEDNKAKLFKPYKDFCHRVALIFLEFNSVFPFPHSLASTLIETAHHQIYFKRHLPSLTDFGNIEDTAPLVQYLELLVFNTLSPKA